MNSPKEFPGLPASGRKSHLRPRRSMHALESRIVFDGAAVATVDALSQASADAAILPDAIAPVANPRTEIVFVESNVRDYQSLLDGMAPGAEVHVLDAAQDGLAQIATILDGRSGIDAIHIVSHGSEGSVNLGTLTLTAANLQDHAADLATIGGALDANADILLYGCDVAAGGDGAALIEALAQATQADIAASTDTTGATARGGDWVLEAATGTISADQPIEQSVLQSYGFELAQVNFDFDGDSYTGNAYGGALLSEVTVTVGGEMLKINTDTTFLNVDGVEAMLSYAGSNLNNLGVFNFDGYATTLSLSINGGKSFDLDSFGIYGLGTGFQNSAWTPVFQLATNSGSTLQFTLDLYTDWEKTLNVSGNTNFDGVTSVTLTLVGYKDAATLTDWATAGDMGGYAVDASKFAVALDNFLLSNITAPDSTAPTVTSIDRQTPASATTNADSLVYQVTFDEAVSNVDATDFAVTGSTATVTNVASAGGNAYNVTVSGGNLASLNGAVTLGFAGGQNITDTAGNALSNTTPTGTNNGYTLDNTAPNAPTAPDMTAGTDSGSSSTDNLTSDTTPTFTGTAEADSTVTLYDTDGTTVLGTATATGGNWSITSSALSAGAHTLTAKATDAVGNVSSASTGLGVTIDTSAAAPASLDLATASDSGSNTADNLTSDTTPTFTGTAEVGATVTLYDTDGTTSLGSATADGSGNWSITASALGAGAHTLTAKQTDLAGNTSAASAGLAITIDATAPNAPSTPDITAGTDSGSNTDNLTNDTTPTFTGTAEADSTVTLYDTDGTTVLGTATATGGNWSITSSALSAGAHTLTAKATDVAGNISVASGGLSVIIDTTAPTVSDARIGISGDSGTGGAYKIGDTVTATWDNTGTGDNNLDIGGVTVNFSAFGGGAAVAASNSGNTWTATYTIVAGAIDGTNKNVSVTATDNAGNTTTTADTTNATLDNIAPTVTDGNIAISGGNGTGGAFKIGDTVTATWNNTAGGDNNADTISSATVDFGAFGDGAAVAASNSGGTWTATYTLVTGAVNGTNMNVSVTATDNAGNTTTTADTSNATADTTAPAIANAVASQAVNDNATLSPFATMTFTEANTLTVQITLDVAAKGSFTTLNGFTDAGGGVYTYTGTAANATAAIQGLVFTPAANRVAAGSTEATTFTVAVTDAAGNTASDAATTVVSTSINDAPVLNAAASPALNGLGINPAAPSNGSTAGSTLVSALVGGITDADTGTVQGIAVTATDTVNGTLYYSTNGGTTWTAAGAVADNSALLLASDANTRLYYQSNNGISGNIASALTFRAWDQTSGTAGNKVDTTTNGNATAFSTATDTASIAIYPPPTIGSVSAGQAVNDDATVSPFAASTIANAGTGNNVTVTVTLDTQAKGSFTTLSGFTDNNDGSYTLTNVTAAAAQTTIRGLVFTPAANRVNPTLTETTTFTVTVTDVTTTVAATDATTTVVSTSINDAPAVGGATAVTNIDDTATATPFSAFTISDADTAQTQTLTVTLDAAAQGALSNLSGGTYDAGAGVYTFTGTAAQAQTAIRGLVFTPTANHVNPTSTETTTFTVSVNDGITAATTDATTTVVATSVNDAPTVANGIADQGASVSQAFSFTVPVNSFADVDVGQTLTYAATLADDSVLPAWLSFNAATRVFSGTPASGDVGTINVKVTATDSGPGNLSVFDTFSLVIADGPSVSSIVRAGGASATVAGSATSVDYTVTFSESVTGVDASDFALTTTGTATGNIASVTGSGTTYTVTINSLSGDGTLRLDLNGSGTGIQNGGSAAILGGYSSGATYTLDHTAPAITFSALSLSADTGASNTDFVTASAAQTIGATLSAGLGAGDVAYGSLDNGATWTDVTAKVAGATLTWDGVTLTGSSTLQLKVTDSVGNDGTVASQAYVLDQAVSAPTLALASDTGATDSITANGQVNVSGLEAGATWEYSLTGGTSWTAGTGTSVTLSGDGAKSITVRQTDVAGNVSASSTLSFTLDTTAPTNTIATRAFSIDTGTSATDFVTNSAAQTISGTLSANLAAGEFVEVSLDNGATWIAATGSTGQNAWSLAGQTLVGSNTLQVRVTDAAGNSGAVATQAYVLDTVAPPVTFGDLAFSADTGVVGDFKTMMPTQTVSATLGAPLGVGDTVWGTLDNGATWTDITAKVAGTTLTWDGVTLSGSNTLQLKVTDSAGNDGVVASQAYVLEAAPPLLPPPPLPAAPAPPPAPLAPPPPTPPIVAPVVAPVIIPPPPPPPINVLPVPELPSGTVPSSALVVDNGIGNFSIGAGNSFTYTIPKDAFLASSPNERLSFQATQVNGAPLPNWLHFNPETGTFSGEVPEGVRELRIRVKAVDGHGNEATTTFTIRSGGVNRENGEQNEDGDRRENDEPRQRQRGAAPLSGQGLLAMLGVPGYGLTPGDGLPPEGPAEAAAERPADPTHDGEGNPAPSAAEGHAPELSAQLQQEAQRFSQAREATLRHLAAAERARPVA